MRNVSIAGPPQHRRNTPHSAPPITRYACPCQPTGRHLHLTHVQVSIKPGLPNSARSSGLACAHQPPSPVDRTPRCSQVDGHRRLTPVQMRVPMPARRTTLAPDASAGVNRPGQTTTPGQPGCQVRTNLPAPSTGSSGAATSMDTGARRKCRCTRPCQPAGRHLHLTQVQVSIDPATKQRPVNRAGNHARHAPARFNGRRYVAGELHTCT